MKQLVKRFIEDESGMETLEWTMVGALVVLGFLALWNLGLKDAMGLIFNKLTEEMTAAGTTAPAT